MEVMVGRWRPWGSALASLMAGLSLSAPSAAAEPTPVVRPGVGVELGSASRSGNQGVRIQGFPALPAARFLSTPLARPFPLAFSPGTDTTPATPWDDAEGRGHVLVPLDAAGPAAGVVHYVHVDALPAGTPAAVDIYLGLDADGNGQPSPDEVRCVARLPEASGCGALLPAPQAGVAAYWVMLHNLGAESASASLLAFDVPLLDGDGSLVATGPGQLSAGEDFGAKLSWQEPGLLDGEFRMGYVRVESAPGVVAGAFPVRLQRTGSLEEPLLLASGKPVTLRLAPGASHRRIFIDVPEGSTNLRVSTSAPDASFRIQLVHGGTDADPADTTVPEAPAAGVATARVKRGDVLQAVPAPGRWYVVARNEGAMPGAMTITATIEGVAPVVRPGSYFNAARPGHGLFLYPAGNQWAGLWYAYADDGRPTWYYLQGAAPGANGAWAGDLYRAAWHGTSNVLAKVGLATVTPTGPDAFTFSYTLDGLSGSEPMAALGRGCPTLAGLPQDLSSHWFNPQRAGTGYSVQLWEQYEYLAAFVYDGRGEPRFLAAERNGFGGAETVLALEQLRGACPTCAWVPPVRASVGTLLRRIANGALSHIELDVEYTDGVPGTWAAIDGVEPLGGAGTTQGCQR